MGKPIRFGVNLESNSANRELFEYHTDSHKHHANCHNGGQNYHPSCFYKLRKTKYHKFENKLDHTWAFFLFYILSFALIG